jgi:hypothetical protein
VCDTPGFEDTDGAEVDISNSIGIYEALRECKSVVIVLIVNYHQLFVKRGDSLRETLRILKHFMQDYR